MFLNEGLKSKEHVSNCLFTNFCCAIYYYVLLSPKKHAFAKGSVHDFKLFKESSCDYNPSTPLFIDMGYIGIEKIHKNSIIPIKSSFY